MPKIEKKCILCKMTVDDPVKLGEFKTYKKISAHYYCLLLTTQLLQNGDDNQGILGFMPSDIYKEERRIRKQICGYCHKMSANIACCASKCRKVFHLLCGLENSAICHFMNDFRTICGRHPVAERRKCSKKDNCVICVESMGSYHRVMSILAPCCRSGWFHKWCIAKFALSAGYFFKCPLCNNRDVFRSKLVHKGIFVPDQDATWELEPNAFSELLVRPESCSAEKCKCPRGRSYKMHPYTLRTCETCGSNAIHSYCLEKKSNEYNCQMCDEILNASSAVPSTPNQQEQPQQQQQPSNSPIVIDDEDEEVDVVSFNNDTEQWNIVCEVNVAEDDDLEKQCPNDSIDSLLLTSIRRTDRKKNCTRSDSNNGSSFLSGDSVLCIDKDNKNESKYIRDHKDDMSDEELMLESVIKCAVNFHRSKSENLSTTPKRKKCSSSSLDSMHFEHFNRSFDESDDFSGRIMNTRLTSFEDLPLQSIVSKDDKCLAIDLVQQYDSFGESVFAKPSKMRKLNSNVSPGVTDAIAGPLKKSFQNDLNQKSLQKRESRSSKSTNSNRIDLRSSLTLNFSEDSSSTTLSAFSMEAKSTKEDDGDEFDIGSEMEVDANDDVEERCENDSVDSLLFSSSRHKEDRINDSGRCESNNGCSDLSGDSVSYIEKDKNKSKFISDTIEVDEYVDLIYRRVKKRKISSHENLPASLNQIKDSSSSNVLFDDCTKRVKKMEVKKEDVPLKTSRTYDSQCPKLGLVDREGSLNESILYSKSRILRKKNSIANSSSELFSGYADTIEDLKKSQNEMVHASNQKRSMYPLKDEDNSRSTKSPNRRSIDTSLPRSKLNHSKDSSTPISSTAAHQPRLRGRAKSTFVERTTESNKITNYFSPAPKSQRLRSRSVSGTRELNVRRSLRLRDKPNENLYEEDLIYVSELDGNYQRKPFSDNEILRLFVNSNARCDNRLRRSRLDDICKENMESSFKKRRGRARKFKAK